MKPLTLTASLAIMSSLLFGNSQCYLEGYPQLIESADESAIVLRDGTRFPYRNTLPKSSWDEKISNADLSTQLEQSYDAGGFETPPPYLHSRDGLRYRPFFSNPSTAKIKNRSKNLVSIQWPTLKGNKLQSKQGGRGRQKTLCHRTRDCCVTEIGSDLGRGATTYCYRVIKDTDRLSMHSFGIAIDLAPNTTQYWKDEASSETFPLVAIKIRCLSLSSVFSKNTVLSGGDAGITTTPCTLSTDLNFSHPHAKGMK